MSIQGSSNSHSSCIPPTSVGVDEALHSIGYGPVQFIAFVFAGLTTFSFAFDVMVFEFIDLSVQTEWNLSSVQFAFLPSMTGIANIPGGLMYGVLSDRYGRVWPFALALANVGLFGLASAFSPNFISLIFLRVVTSFGTTGVASLAYPTLIEFLPTGKRGKILVLVFLIQSVGSCLCSGLAWWLIPTFTQSGWRYLIIASSLPSLIALVYRLVFYLESPRYLIARGKFIQAKKVLVKMAYLNRKSIDIPNLIDSEQFPPAKYRIIKATVRQFLTMFKPLYLRRTVCLSIIYVLETSSYYASSVFLPEALKTIDPNIDPYFAVFIGLLGQLPGIVLMSIIIEWRGVGRLNSLRFFTILCIIFFLLLAFVQNSVSIPVLIILVYFAMVPIIPLMYTYISECYPTEIRGFAMGFINDLSAFSGIFFPYLSGYLASVSIPWIYPTVFAGFFALQLVFSLILNYETLGTNLKDII